MVFPISVTKDADLMLTGKSKPVKRFIHNFGQLSRYFAFYKGFLDN